MGLNIKDINGGIKTTKKEEADFSAFDSPLDMAKKPNPYKILIYGYPSSGKTHFCCSAPAPVVVLDSENRVGNIVGKFSDKDGKQKMIYAKQWHTFDELEEGIDLAIKTLKNHEKNTGEKGTIAIDSMTREWEEIHKKYLIEKYGADANRSDTRLDPMQDYKKLNEMHNNLMDKLFDSDLNIIFTATAKPDFKEDRFNPSGIKPEGQKHLGHAVDYTIHAYQKEDSVYGEIQKNSLVLTELDEIKLLDFNKFTKIVERLKKVGKIRTYEEMKKEIESMNEKTDEENNEE